MTYFISRHPGARAWAEAQGLAVDQRLEALDPALIQPGDRVLGTLPVHLAAEVCRRGGRYFHLRLELPREHRGMELDAAAMAEHGARLEEFLVSRAGPCD